MLFFFFIFSPLPGVPLSGQMFCGKVVLADYTRCDVSKLWNYSKFTYEEEEHNVPSSWQIFSCKKEGTYAILKLYSADAEKILWEREKEIVLLNRKL